jgi:hypothetical protein
VILHVRRHSTSGVDDYGNPVDTFGPPVVWDVWWLAPGTMREIFDARDASEIIWTVGAAADSDAPTEFDRVVVDGSEFAVNGRPADWTRGPVANPTAGLTVELRRVEG